MQTTPRRVAPLTIVGIWQLLTASGTGSLARPTVDDSSVLLQRSSDQARLARDAEEEELRQRAGEGSWTTTPFASCSKFCGFDLSTRTVACRSWKTGEVLSAGSCSPRPRPVAVQNCSCALEVCVQQPEGPKLCGPGEGDVTDDTAKGSFELVGCYNRSAAFPGGGACQTALEHDEGCLNWKGEDACGGGLPFYSSCVSDRASCSTFCLKKGLDLSGIVGGVECRCGASVLNENVWHGKTPPPALLFKDGPDGPWNSGTGPCNMSLSRYTGFFSSGGVPLVLTKTFLDDHSYVDGLVVGHHLSPAQIEG